MKRNGKTTDPHQETISEMIEGLTRDGSLNQVGARSKVPITEDDRNAAVVKALAISDPVQIESPRHLINWMGKVAYHHSVDRYRQKRRQRLLPNTTLSQVVPDRPVAGRRELVWKCLKALPETEQRILDAYYYENCTDGGLAVLLFGSATPAASQRTRRQRLKALLLLAEKLKSCEL